jgi:hypothetical protein
VPALTAERDAAGTGLKVRANVVLMRDNIAGFATLCRTLAGWGVDEISFNQLGGRDRPEFYPAHRLRAEDVAQLVAEVPRLRAELGQTGTALVGGTAYLERFADTVALAASRRVASRPSISVFQSMTFVVPRISTLCRDSCGCTSTPIRHATAPTARAHSNLPSSNRWRCEFGCNAGGGSAPRIGRSANPLGYRKAPFVWTRPIVRNQAEGGRRSQYCIPLRKVVSRVWPQT